MPRPVKCRKICFYPINSDYGPLDEKEALAINLSLDEYETIRLIDYMKLSQQECALCMKTSRTTVQRIYETARFKLAMSLVEGKRIHIEGGDFHLCKGESCGLGACYLKNIVRELGKKKENQMRIAVTFENGDVFQHFGHTKQFKIVDVENDQISTSKIVDTKGNGHGALAGLLKSMDVDVLICGGIGQGAINALKDLDIKLYGGVRGSADMAIRSYLCGTLLYDPNVHCDHHDHGEDHDCGSHSCTK